jgi:DNA mismatch repair protein MutS2
MTASVGAAAPALGVASHLCGELEFQFAKARFAREYDAGAATFAADGDPRLELRGARHPVLLATLRAQKREVVPLGVEMAQQRVLVISGPNTGGKTVALKTVGVAAWMAQCGLPVCASSAVLPIFDAILADIGDAQSISESLSTFSSHLLHIREILHEASARTLVLLDELGAATSPSEGAALAVAISESLRQRRAWTLISTHHDDLKAWATSQPDVLNASVGFDTATLQPTYCFRVGIPGVSAGLDMAQRLGLQPEIVAAARQLMTAEELKASEFLRRLQEELAAAEQERRQLGERLEWVRRREAELERSDRADLQRKLTALERQFEQLSRQWEREVRDAAKAIEDQAAALQLKKEAERTAARLRQEAHEAFRAQVMSALGSHAPAPAPKRPAEVKVGDRVRLENVQKIGRVLRREGSRLEVEVGNLRLRAGVHEVVEVLNEAGTPVASRISGAELDADRAEGGSLLELNLIGQRTDEAVDRLDKFLDNAVLSELSQVRIVHGFGTGALRRAVTDALRHHPQVARYYHPPHNEGGNGVTIAEMKQ